MRKFWVGVLVMLFILPCAFLFVACGNDNDGNGGDDDTPAVTYVIQVIGGSGSGTYDHDDDVTIVSGDVCFLWWQENGTSVKLSTSKTYTFKATKDLVVKSYGSDRNAGFAVYEFDYSGINPQLGDVFTSLGSNAYIGTTEVAAFYNNKGYFENTEGFNYIGGNFGLTTGYEVKQLSNHAIVYWLYNDIDGGIKATSFGSVGTLYGLTFTMDIGYKIAFEDIK